MMIYDDSEFVKKTSHSTPEPKWAAILNDTLYPMPREALLERDILDQCGAPSGARLIRDRGTPDDGGFLPDEIIHLREGNVFRLSDRNCELLDRDLKERLAKFAFACDDAWEVTLVGKQSGRSLKRLLGVDASSDLYRDFESPTDILIGEDDEVSFIDGCVFRSQRHNEEPRKIQIFVNTRPYFVTQRIVSYKDVVALAYPNPDYDNKIYSVKYTDGVPPRTEGSVSPGDSVKVKNGTCFSVAVSDKS